MARIKKIFTNDTIYFNKSELDKLYNECKKNNDLNYKKIYEIYKKFHLYCSKEYYPKLNRIRLGNIESNKLINYFKSKDLDNSLKLYLKKKNLKSKIKNKILKYSVDINIPKILYVPLINIIYNNNKITKIKKNKKKTFEAKVTRFCAISLTILVGYVSFKNLIKNLIKN